MHSTEIHQSSLTVGGGIQVIELPDIDADASGGVFGAVLAAYRHEGFEAGRTRAINDALAVLAPIAEDYLRRHPEASSELRSFVYSLGASLEKHLKQSDAAEIFLEGGLGI